MLADDAGVSGAHSSSSNPLLDSILRSPQVEEPWNKLLDIVMSEQIGDEGLCSMVPALYRVLAERSPFIWQGVMIVAKAELIRRERSNLILSPTLSNEFTDAIDRIGTDILERFASCADSFHLRSMLVFLAAWKGGVVYATAMIEYSEKELGEYFISEA